MTCSSASRQRRCISTTSAAPYIEAGQPTQLTKPPGQILEDGYYHSLGHGVGLDVHEYPSLGRSGAEPMVPGDVIAVEPGTVDPDHGGMRVEDLLLVTEDGYENLTASFTYDLTP